MERSAFDLRKVLVASMLVAIATVMKLISDIPLHFTGASFTIRLEMVVFMFGGIVLGPYFGFLIGALTDILYVLFSPFGVSFPTLFTLSAMLWGGVAGLIFHGQTKPGLKRFSLFVVVLSVVTMLLDSVQLYILGIGTADPTVGFMAQVWALARFVRLPFLWPVQIAATLYLLRRLTPYLHQSLSESAEW